MIFIVVTDICTFIASFRDTSRGDTQQNFDPPDMFVVIDTDTTCPITRHDIVPNHVVEKMKYVVEVSIAKTVSCSVSCDVVSCGEVCRAMHGACRVMCGECRVM